MILFSLSRTPSGWTHHLGKMEESREQEKTGLCTRAGTSRPWEYKGNR